MSAPPKNTILAYDSLRHVICHLEQNLRRKVADRMPDVRSADNNTTVKIHKLAFSQYELSVDDTRYKLGIIRLSRLGQTPPIVVDQNNNGGIQHELNQFGVEDKELEMRLTPGDILLHYPADDMYNIAQAQEQRNRMEHYLRQKDRYDVLNLLSIDSLRKELDRAQSHLDDLIRQRDNVLSPYDMYIQLTKTSPDGTISFERLSYNQDLAAAQKHLMTKMLGHYRGVLNIDSLIFNIDQLLILRLPEGLKISAQNLSINGPSFSEYIDRLKPILANLDHPLESLQLECLVLKDCMHPVVQKAKLLIARELIGELATLKAITNKEFVCKMLLGNLNVYGDLIEHWKGTGGRDVGTCFKCWIDDEETSLYVFEKVKERFNEVVERERLLTIPFPNSTQLNLSYEAVPEDQLKLEDEIDMLFLIKMEIVALSE